MGNLFVQFFNDSERFGQFSSTATTGGVQNVIFMENGITDFGIIGQSVFVQAVDGTDSFAETGPDDNLVIIAPLYGAIFQQFVSKDIHSEAESQGQEAHCRRPRFRRSGHFGGSVRRHGHDV